MKGYFVYRQIQQLREKGFRKNSVAKQLGLDWRTVNRYWEMDADAYEQSHEQVCRANLLEEYEGTILGWLREYPVMSAALIDITKKWTGRRQDRSMIHAQLAVFFAGCRFRSESPACTHF